MIRRNVKKRGSACLLAVILAGECVFPTGSGISGIRINAMAQETEELLIEDDGELVVNHSGADLEELKAAEQKQSESAAEELAEDSDVRLEAADGERLQAHLDALLEVESPIGSDGELICAAYIKEVLERYGYTLSEQPFHEGFLNEDGVDAPGLNLIAERGADSRENRTRDIFIISTHYDSKTKPDPEDPLANDKSGAAILLEMARILSYIETDTDICFLFLSGEEDGGYGSASFLKSLKEEEKERVAGILYVEKVGYEPDMRCILETVDGEENAIGNLVREAAGIGETVIELQETELSWTEAVESEEMEDWAYAEDEREVLRHFAREDIAAVMVCQDMEEADGDHSPELQMEIEELQQVTDLLAAAVSRIMSDRTDSLRA